MFKVDEAIPNPSLDSFKAWERQITEPNERKVFSALSDEKWDFRTVEGISRDTGISESEIREIIEKYPKWFRKSLLSIEKAGNFSQCALSLSNFGNTSRQSKGF